MNTPSVSSHVHLISRSGHFCVVFRKRSSRVVDLLGDKWTECKLVIDAGFGIAFQL